MATKPDPNKGSSSNTRWGWVPIIGTSAGGQKPSRPKVVRKQHRWATWDVRKPLRLTVTYRGGSECWYEFHTRGGVIRRPGVTSIHDLMDDVYRGHLKNLPGDASGGNRA